MAMYTKRLEGGIYHVIEYNRYTTSYMAWPATVTAKQKIQYPWKKIQLRQSCKRKAEDDLTERPRKIIVTEGLSMVYLHRNQDMFGDGTFKSCPKHFEQLYTIITFADGMYVPVAFFLLPGSSKEVYQKMFKLLYSLQFEVTGSCLEGKILHLDFEQAALAAAKLSLPGLALKGCPFHLKQSRLKKFQKVGLSEEFKNPDSEIGQFLKITFGLLYLDPLDVCESYAFDILGQAPDDQRIDEYLEYLAKT